MTGQEALTWAIPVLQAGGVDVPARDARKLLAHALGVDAGRITLVLPDVLTPGQDAAFRSLIDQRARRVPVSHLIGMRAFFGRDFEVGPDVLDPRPETETLVELALQDRFGRVLDLGTGSGCILLTLLAERGVDAFGVGTDLSPHALAVAGRNAAKLRVADRVQFHVGDWFDALPHGMADFDLIVSNPPYIAADEMPQLAPEVREFEPRMALTDEADGLSAYRHMTAGAGDLLAAGGQLRFEIGPSQGQAVRALMLDAGFADVEITCDLDGRDRVVSGKKPGET